MKTDLQLVLNKLQERRYSASTQKVYLFYLKQFAVFLKGKPLNGSTSEDVQNFLLDLIDMNASVSAQNQAINAIKFYHEKILKKSQGLI